MPQLRCSEQAAATRDTMNTAHAKVVAFIVAVLAVYAPVLAADYPVKPVRIIVPTIAGAGLDTLTR